jgi:hypothetical protein
MKKKIIIAFIAQAHDKSPVAIVSNFFFYSKCSNSVPVVSHIVSAVTNTTPHKLLVYVTTKITKL